MRLARVRECKSSASIWNEQPLLNESTYVKMCVCDCLAERREDDLGLEDKCILTLDGRKRRMRGNRKVIACSTVDFRSG